MNSVLKLYLTMALTFLVFNLLVLGIFFILIPSSLMTVVFFVLILNFVEFLFSPYIVEFSMHCKEFPKEAFPEIYDMYLNLCQKAGFTKPPKLMISEVDIPNAFAYGTPLTGYRVAVTKPLIELLDLEELEAVLGHELGHIKHKDCLIMSLLTTIPNIISQIAFFLFFMSDRDEYFLIAELLFLLSYVLTLILLFLSRTREYYADYFSSQVSHGDGYALQRALVKISAYTNNIPKSSINTLFFANYSGVCGMSIDECIENLKNASVSIWHELFSTHPALPKRIRFLESIKRRV